MVQRYNPDYVMHAARFAPFARENEHGEFVKFSDYEALLSELASSRQINAQTLLVKLTMAETIKKLTDRVNVLTLENAALKAINDDRRMFIMNGVQLGYIKVPTVEVDPALETIRIAVSPQVPTPATDAALAAIRARAKAEAFAEIIEFIDRRSGLAEMKTQWDLSSATVAHISELREAK